jgi:hypothetical protein
MVKGCSISLNGVNTNVDLNIIPLVSYDILIGMDWLDKHHVVLDCHNTKFTCVNEEGKHIIVKGVPRPISIREISSLQLKRCLGKDANCMQPMWRREKGKRGQALKIFWYYKRLNMYSKKYQVSTKVRDIFLH